MCDSLPSLSTLLLKTSLKVKMIVSPDRVIGGGQGAKAREV